MSKQYPEQPLSMNPWELTVLRIGSKGFTALDAATVQASLDRI